MKLRMGTDMSGNPLLLLTVFALMAALQLIGIGVLGELGIRIYYGQGHQRPYAIAERIGFPSRDERHLPNAYRNAA